MTTAAAKVNEGFQFVNCGADLWAVAKTMGDDMAKLKSLLESIP